MSKRQVPPCLDTLVEENRWSLQQLEAFLAMLSPAQYRHAFDAAGRQTLGRHLRHILDHFQALLDGVGAGRIDYESRERDPRLEREPGLARERLAEIRRGLERLTEHSSTAMELTYPVEAGGVSLSLPTSLARELAFLTSHTVHHMALLGLLAERLGVVLPEHFGVHPSTLRHWQREAGRAQSATGRQTA
ncbi:MAG: DinB family protein [Halomonas sp.]